MTSDDVLGSCFIKNASWLGFFGFCGVKPFFVLPAKSTDMMPSAQGTGAGSESAGKSGAESGGGGGIWTRAVGRASDVTTVEDERTDDMDMMSDSASDEPPAPLSCRPSSRCRRFAGIVSNPWNSARACAAARHRNSACVRSVSIVATLALSSTPSGTLSDNVNVASATCFDVVITRG